MKITAQLICAFVFAYAKSRVPPEWALTSTLYAGVNRQGQRKYSLQCKCRGLVVRRLNECWL